MADEYLITLVQAGLMLKVMPSAVQKLIDAGELQPVPTIGGDRLRHDDVYALAVKRQREKRNNG